MRRIVYFILLILVAVLLIRWFTGSLFFTAPERLHILVYGQDTRVYSIDTQGNSHYIIHFAPDEKVGVPGGYGLYRVGAVGKLVSLEKKPELFGRTFSAASSNFISYYFYPAGDELYYGREVSRDIGMPTPTELWQFSTNANMFDRLYLFLHFVRVKKNEYMLLRSRGDAQEKNGARIFLPETFSKETEGFLFNPAYRAERQTVQIIYTKSYSTARLIGNILEGSGIRVVDITQNKNSHSKCVVRSDKATTTARALASFFNCPVESGKSEVSDILFDIRGIEKDWNY